MLLKLIELCDATWVAGRTQLEQLEQLGWLAALNSRSLC